MGGSCAQNLPFKVFLFDIGNVLVQWSPRNLYACRFEDPREMQQFFDTCCTQSWHENHDRGISMDANAAPLIKRFPHWADHIRAWKSEWAQMFDGPVPGAAQLIEDLYAQGVPLFALTNMPAEVMPGLRTMFPFLSLFHDIIVSGEEGVLKPDPEIFDRVVKRLGFAPKDIVFIDDAPDNTQAAQALGFDAVLFKSIDKLRTQIAARGFEV